MEEPKVEIGLREIYDVVLEMKGILMSHPAKLEDHEDRIRALEMKVWTFAGIASIASVIASQFIGTLFK